MASVTDLKERFPGLAGLDLFQGMNEQKILKWSQEQMEQCRRTRLQFERQWFLNMAFYFGRQYYQWTSELGPVARLIEPSSPPWRVRSVSNKIKPIARTEHAKLNKEHPQPYIVPATTDDEDLQAARAGEAILEHLSREHKINKMLRRATFWQILTGNGFVKDWWDPKELAPDDQYGVLKWEALTPFHIYVPSMLEEEIENQPYVIHSVAKSPWWIRKTYGKALEAQKSGNPVESVMHRIYQALGMQQDSSEVIHVHEMIVKESEHFPQGGKIVWAQDQVLHMEMEWPFVYRDYNLTHLTHVPTGRFYADSVIPDLIPLQKEYNRTKSQIIEAKNLTAKPQYRAPAGSVDASKMTSEPGLVIFYRPGFEAIEPMPPQQLPPYVMDSLELIQRDMDDISSQHEVTKGRTPPGVTAATAIAYLQEEDDSKLAATVASLEEGVEKIGTHALTMVKEYWTTERTVRVTGKEQLYEAYQFKGADLRDNTTVFVEAGSAAPRSKAAKQAFLMELGDKGWIPPDQVLRYLDMAEAGSLYRDLQVDVRQAQRENIMMYHNWKEIIPTMEDEVTGMEVGTLEVNDWDNHQLHIKMHDDFRKRQTYNDLPEEAQEVFQRHVELHKMLTGQQFGVPIESGDQLPAGLDPSIEEVPPEMAMEQPALDAPEGNMPQEVTQMEPSGGPQPAGGEMPPEGEEPQ